MSERSQHRTSPDGAPVTVLVTGERGSGKTTVCVRLAESLSARGVEVGGVMTLPRLDDDGRRSALDIVHLHSSTRIELAILARPVEDARRATLLGRPRPARERRADDVALGPWNFRREALEEAVRWLEADAAAGRTLLVDEIGPLELRDGAGLLAGYRRALQSGCGVATVIRPELHALCVEEIATTSQVRAASILTVTIDEPSRIDSIHASLLAMLAP